MKKNKYENIINDLKLGDLVLFSGKGVCSFFIKLFSVSIYSHVGMIIEDPNYTSILLFESTGLSNIKNIFGKKISGVQTVYLRDRIKSYKGDIYIKKLNIERTEEMYKSFDEFRKKVSGRSYEKSKLELLKSAIDFLCFFKNKKNLKSIFCSELIAESYKVMKLLDQKISSNEYIPRDFSHNKIFLLKGYFSNTLIKIN